MRVRKVETLPSERLLYLVLNSVSKDVEWIKLHLLNFVPFSMHSFSKTNHSLMEITY